MTDQDLLPLHNLQVLAPHLPDEITADGVAEAVRAPCGRGDVGESDQPIALALHWDREPAYPLAPRALRRGGGGAGGTWARDGPSCWLSTATWAEWSGASWPRKCRPGADVVSVDELTLSDFDYIDIGAEIKHVQAVPVIIKSLVFRPEHPLAHDHEYLHRHGLTHDHPHSTTHAHASARPRHGHDHEDDHDHGHGRCCHDGMT